jgi:hypothetical protein
MAFERHRSPEEIKAGIKAGIRARHEARRQAVKGAVRRGKAWAPTAKATALFVLPLPLVATLVTILVSGDMTRLPFVLAALASLWSSGVVTARALAGEARYILGERPDPPALPMKLMSAGLTAAGAGLAATAGGHPLLSSLIFSALGAAGHVSFFGRDIRPPDIRIVAVAGIDLAAVTLLVKQAYGRLRAIEAAGSAIAVPEFRERLTRITAIGRSILSEIERDPSDAARARRFLNVYLDSAERVTVDYARTHAQRREQPLEQNFRQLLVDMENTFAGQHKKLIERDLMSLDVDIEVLNARLKQEGVS